MNIDEIKSRIRGDIGKEIFFYNTVSSTNTIASELASEISEGTVVLADCQEKGRGRLGRVWVSPPAANIYMSVFLKPDIKPKDATLITIMTAVASATALRRITGLGVAIKWPNDLTVSDRKLGGILTELKIEQKKILFAVIGIGINVNIDIGSFPEEIRNIATSLKSLTGIIYSREEIVSETLNEIDIWYRILKKMDRNALIIEWKKLTSTLGKRVMVVSGRETFTGLAESIDDEGLLILRLPSGEKKKISSGDLTVL